MATGFLGRAILRARLIATSLHHPGGEPSWHRRGLIQVMENQIPSWHQTSMRVPSSANTRRDLSIRQATRLIVVLSAACLTSITRLGQAAQIDRYIRSLRRKR
jgi:hypothetical protein